MPNYSTSQLTIDLNAVATNLDFFNQKSGNVIAMVKAQGYGTNALYLSHFLEMQKVAFLGVSHVNEGVSLRKLGIKHPIFVINVPPFEAEGAVRYQLSPAVSTLEEIEALQTAAKLYGKKTALHLHINTGMNRFGVMPEMAHPLISRVNKASHLYLDGIMTHFSCADSQCFDLFSQKQIDLFKSMLTSLDSLPRWIHAANSAAAMRFDLPFCNLSRIGLGLFGFGSFSDGLDPAISFNTHLTSIAHCHKGESIGYDQAAILSQDTLIGVIPVGYHDGLHRHFSTKGYVKIHGKKAPFVGHICMDFALVDVSAIPEAKIGSAVTVFDAHLRPETVASWGQTDVRELLACIGPRVYRTFKPIRNIENERLSKAVYSLEKSASS